MVVTVLEMLMETREAQLEKRPSLIVFTEVGMKIEVR